MTTQESRFIEKLNYYSFIVWTSGSILYFLQAQRRLEKLKLDLATEVKEADSTTIQLQTVLQNELER